VHSPEFIVFYGTIGLLFIDISLLVLVSDLCHLVFLLIKYNSVLGLMLYC
jgi:hypothetical protein